MPNAAIQIRLQNGVKIIANSTAAVINVKTAEKQFDDLTDIIFSGRHQPVKVWISCLYLMGLNLSNRQIALELNLNESDVQKMAFLSDKALQNKDLDQR
ncbi:MAG: hypothetical protein MZV65_21585 [Chromatiales bacterium]|nr:hypothetical protein [Chromatiales bacterium]